MDDKKLTERLKKALVDIDPQVTGAITVTVSQGTAFLAGQLVTSKKNIIDFLVAQLHEIRPELNVMPAVTVNNGLFLTWEEDMVREGAFTVDDTRDNTLDEVRTLFQGSLSLGLIQVNNEHKRENWNTRQKIANCIEVVGFIAPIVLDRALKVIDGNLRLSVAKEYGWENVPVVIVDAEGVKADFLRLVLNRSSEFQRWKYDEVDAYIDATPQAQPLLEPLGFFGERILPETFFGQTVLEYRIHDDFKSQQSFYKQEEGLAKWAEIQRARIQEEEDAKQARKKKPKADAVSLFDLAPEDEDFTATYDVKTEVSEHVTKMREVAGTITESYDEVRRAEKEAKGQAWQTVRRSPKKVIADLEAEALTRIEQEEVEDDINE